MGRTRRATLFSAFAREEHGPQHEASEKHRTEPGQTRAGSLGKRKKRPGVRADHPPGQADRITHSRRKRRRPELEEVRAIFGPNPILPGQGHRRNRESATASRKPATARPPAGAASEPNRRAP